MSTPSRRAALAGLAGLSLSAVAAPAAAAAETSVKIVRTVSWLSMFSLPRPNSLRIASIPRGATVVATGRTASSGAFAQVRYNGRQGWVMSHYLGAVAVPTTQINQQFSYGSKSSLYHVRAGGLDFSRPVGIAWYFDGDYGRRGRLIVSNPDTGQMLELEREACARNFVLIGVETPDYRTDAGYTWWKDMVANGEYLRALAASIFQRYPFLARDRQWLTGWSGGAEFIAKDLLAKKQGTWLDGGGATIVGGGGEPNRGFDPAPARIRAMPLTWHVADDDDYTAAKAGWSAEVAATEGERAYRTLYGFTRTRLVKYPAGEGAHHSYDIPALMASDMDRAGHRPLA